MSSLSDRLDSVRQRISDAAARSGRRASDVRLVAVSKTVTPEVIIEAYRLGQTEFGENRVQEFHEKRPSLEAAGVEGVFHMVGHLQTNKARLAVGLFDIIQSVDSLKLGVALAKTVEERLPPVPVLLEVTFSPDPARPGFHVEDLEREASDLVALPGLRIQGLMTVAPLGLDEAGVRGVFRQMRSLRDRLASRYASAEWQHLSMGMSEDFEIAIEEGATIVRVGRALFGDRSVSLPQSAHGSGRVG